MWNLKKGTMNLFTNRNIHRYRKQTYGYREKVGRVMNWETGIDIYTLTIYKIDN